MHYMFLLHHDESTMSAPGTPEFLAGVAEFDAFHAELARRGIAWEGHPLQPTATATAVRVRDGKPLVSDGPFAETKEALGGFYVIDLPDLDAAIELAALIPWAKDGTIEVRPVADLAAPEQVVSATR
jgi:hypothetical protein